MENLINVLKVVICYMLIFYIYILIRKNLSKDTRENDVILIKNGRLNIKEIVAKKCSISYILKKLKSDNIKDIEYVDCAILNKDGDIIVYSKVTKEYPINLIIDGNINNATLKQLRKTKRWINDILDDNDIALIDVSYAFILDGLIYIIKKEA